MLRARKDDEGRTRRGARTGLVGLGLLLFAIVMQLLAAGAPSCGASASCALDAVRVATDPVHQVGVGG